MRQISAIAALAWLTALCGTAHAVPGGDLGTLPLGPYLCELPGDAGGASWRRVTEEDFEVINASSYVVGGERGTYLLTGDDAVMTSGPFKTKRYLRVSNGVLKPVSTAGAVESMRCVLTARSNF